MFSRDLPCGLSDQRVSKAIRVLNSAIAFAFEIKLIGGNNHDGEIIVITSDRKSSTCSSSSRLEVSVGVGEADGPPFWSQHQLLPCLWTISRLFGGDQS